MTVKAHVDVVPEEHEHACLAKALTTLADPTLAPVVFGVWLEGEYPETTLIVDVGGNPDREPRKPRIKLDWRLWGGTAFGDMAPDESTDLGYISIDVAVQVEEYAFT